MPHRVSPRTTSCSASKRGVGVTSGLGVEVGLDRAVGVGGIGVSDPPAPPGVAVIVGVSVGKTVGEAVAVGVAGGGAGEAVAVGVAGAGTSTAHCANMATARSDRMKITSAFTVLEFIVSH